MRGLKPREQIDKARIDDALRVIDPFTLRAGFPLQQADGQHQKTSTPLAMTSRPAMAVNRP